MERISHYQILRRLGHGGMGEVFEALDLDLDRKVALKFLSPAYANDPDAMRRFEREARAAAALHHPRIATVFGFDRTTERPFIAMELLGGRTLRETMTNGPLPIDRALAIARDVAAALAFAHRRGIAHRDIKPENLMFDGDGCVKITDFGLARIADSQRLTTTGTTVGTAAYMAPESVGGGSASAASVASPSEAGTSAPPGAAGDVFALGVTLHEMLSGDTPFHGTSPLAMLYSIANEPPRALRAARPDVPEPVESLVLRMLEKVPAARLSADGTARELSLLTGVSPPRPEPVPAPRRSARSWALTFGALLVVLALIPGMLRVRSKSRFREAVVLNNEGHDSLTAGNLDAARKRFEAALERAPKYAESKLNLAVVFHREGDENRAAGLFGQVIAENPSRHDWLAAAHYGMGEIDLQAEAWPSAVLHLTEAVRLDSTRVEYPNNLGFALAQSGRTDQALATLRAAQARFPGEAALTKNVALSWLKAGQFDSALVAANEAVRLRPDYPEAWLLKERSEAALGDQVAARASLQTLRTLSAEPAMIAEAEAALREEPLPLSRPQPPTPPRADP